MTPPSVSVVVLNHNYGRYVGDALASAVGQEPGDYRLAEVVVIDDGSTDHSPEVYRRFPGVRVVRKAHEGFAATLTRAAREAAGDWLAPLDADDAFTPDKLRTLAPHLADSARLLIQHAEYGSALDVTTPPEEVHRLLAAEPNIPEESATYQLMCQLPRYDAATLLDLHAHCQRADPAWQRAVGEFADHVIDLISLWPR